jgi:hypothetical protein
LDNRKRRSGTVGQSPGQTAGKEIEHALLIKLRPRLEDVAMAGARDEP